MKYYLMLRSRARQEQSIAEKHADVCRMFRELPSPWCWVNSEPEAPDPGSGLSAIRSLNKFLSTGIRGQVVYAFRHDFADLGIWDDWIELAFSATKVPFREFVSVILPEMAASFDAYIGEVDPYELLSDSISFLQTQPQALRSQADGRSWVYRVTQVAFYDDQLCHRAFRMSASDVRCKTLPFVESVQLAANGVHIIGSSEVLTVEACMVRSERVTRLLKPDGDF
jgi:hypothetical protein